MSEQPARKGWGSGFLWGCLTPLVVVGLLIAGLVGYGGYYMFAGYKNDATLQSVMAAVQQSPVARSVLGSNIVVSGMPTYSFRYDMTGHSAHYDFAVRGSRGSGTVSASVVIVGSQNQIKSLVLTGPNGQSYNLIGNAAPGAPTNAVWLLARTQTA